MKKIIFFVFLLPISLHAETVNLKMDSIVCENESNLKLLNQENLANQPGDVVLKRVKASQDGYLLLAKSDKIYKDLALKEESIWADTRPSRGTVAAAKATASAKDEESHTEESKKFTEFLAQCMVINESQPADVIEEKPISKTAKIKTLVSGKQYELWTINYYLNR